MIYQFNVLTQNTYPILVVITDTIYLLMYHRLSQVEYTTLFLQLTSNRRHIETSNVIDQLSLNITTKENIPVNMYYRKDNYLKCVWILLILVCAVFWWVLRMNQMHTINYPAIVNSLPSIYCQIQSYKNVILFQRTQLIWLIKTYIII